MSQKNSNSRYPVGWPNRAGKIPVRLLIFLALMISPFVYFGYSGIERHGDFVAVDLKALGNFSFDQQSGTLADVPPRWRALDGKRVMLEGFMFAGQSTAPQISEFEFVYNLQPGRFNSPPLVQERVFVHVPGGRTVPYYDPMCRIWGTLHMKVERSEVGGLVTSVYTMDLDRVETVENNG